MGTPVQTQILDLIGDRLGNIKVSNEYTSTIETIQRARLSPFKGRDMPAINYYYSGDTLTKQLVNGVTERSMAVIVEYYDQTRDEIFTDLANKLSTDVIIALERDMLAPLVSDVVSSSLGGAVMKIDIESITPAIGEGQSPYCGAVLVLNIFYRVARQDPFTLIN